MATRFLLLPAVLAVATACGGPEERTDPARAPASDVVPEVVEFQEHVPPGVRVWHEDFPGAPKRPHVSPRRPGGFYDRTPRQAVEQVVANVRRHAAEHGVPPDGMEAIWRGLIEWSIAREMETLGPGAHA